MNSDPTSVEAGSSFDVADIGGSEPTQIQTEAEISQSLFTEQLIASGLSATPTEQIEASQALPAGVQPGGTQTAGTALPTTIPPKLLIISQPVSGRYQSAATGFQLELRVDVDGAHTMKRISGDFFQIAGATKTYFGSFRVDSPTITFAPTLVTIGGLGKYTWPAACPVIKVTIPRRILFPPRPLPPPGPATVQFFSTSGAHGATYVCKFISRFFRTLQWEEDSVVNTAAFVSYNTGSLPEPPGSPARVLSVVNAYAEAGIEMQPAGVTNIVNMTDAATGDPNKWSDAELHHAMEHNFSLWKNEPQWKVYLLVATSYEGAAGVRGIMYDYLDAFQRQGCAVFYNEIKGADPVNQRAQLRTYVHELGHCFNLLHSWQKNLANPPAPLGPNGGLGDLSWMNYDWRYSPGPGLPSGAAAYWANFPFQFTDNELIHLRHAFYRNVIPGGNAFGTGAAEIDPDVFADPIVDNSGLTLELSSKGAFAFGEPVVVETKLSTTDLRGKAVHCFLHPNETLVQIAIRKPSGQVLVYRPMMEHCVDESKVVVLNQDNPSYHESAYIGYGKDGLYFDRPGTYQLRAFYVAPDGSKVVSPRLSLRVHSPVSAQDEEVGELLSGEQQGKLLYLLGSDADSLQNGNDAFNLLIEKYPDHPLATYARLALGTNAGRNFKRFTEAKRMAYRPAQTGESIALLSSVVDASVGDGGVDNITLNQVLRTLAHSHYKAGDPQKADATLDRMVDIFSKKNLKPYVIRRIAEQADTVRMELETPKAMAREAKAARRS